MNIAIDAMGGDFAPEITIAGAIEAICEQDINIILVGDKYIISDLLSDKKYPQNKLSIIHASQVIEMGESPLIAIKKKKDSSMRKSIELVRDKEADGAVSAGNSGAMMATSIFVLGKSLNVDRPAISVTLPCMTGLFVLIDAGANVDCKPFNLLQFAMMGNAYSKYVLNIASPKIALLSIGEEETKGNELTKEAFKLLKESGLNFLGNIEGKDIFSGQADVVVCDGFIGNVVLKLSEGLVDTMLKMLRREITDIVTGKLAYMMLKPALRNFRKRTDYSEYGGAPLLGINGISIMSHGRSSTKAVKNAIRIASEMAKSKIHENINNLFKLDKPNRS